MHYRRPLALAAALSLGALLLPRSANALDIILNASPGLAGNPAAFAAFEAAASEWEAIFTDPIIVTINAGFDDLENPLVIGQASSVGLSASYAATIRPQWIADAADEADDGIVNFLPNSLSAFLPTGFSLSSLMTFNKANAKAMGFAGLDESFGATDGTITFNSTFAFDFNRNDGTPAELVDFQTVAAHEIGHVLGFVSSVDDVDVLQANGQTGTISMRPLDLFRFADDIPGADPTSNAEFTTTPRLLVPGIDANFDEITLETRLSTGFFTGNGSQASHLLDSDLNGGISLGLMDPIYDFPRGIGFNDARILDLIGWDFQAAVATPEPGSFALTGAVLLGLGLVRRRKSG